MSPVTRLTRLPGRILWSVYMGNFNLVEPAALNSRNKTKLVWSALLTLVTLRMKLI